MYEAQNEVGRQVLRMARYVVRREVRIGRIPPGDAADVSQDAAARLVERGLSPVDPPTWSQVRNAVRDSRHQSPIGHPDNGAWLVDVTRNAKALNHEVGALLDSLLSSDSGEYQAPWSDGKLDLLMQVVVEHGDRFDLPALALLLEGHTPSQVADIFGWHRASAYRRISNWRAWLAQS